MTVQKAPFRVLLVDRDPFLQRAYERLDEERDDLAIDTLASVARARWTLKHVPYDLVVCEFHFGRGVTSEKLIRELVFRRQRVAVATGDVRGAIGALGITVPVYAKPIGLDELLGEIGDDDDDEQRVGAR